MCVLVSELCVFLSLSVWPCSFMCVCVVVVVIYSMDKMKSNEVYVCSMAGPLQDSHRLSVKTWTEEDSDRADSTLSRYVHTFVQLYLINIPNRNLKQPSEDFNLSHALSHCHQPKCTFGKHVTLFWGKILKTQGARSNNYGRTFKMLIPGAPRNCC